MLTGTLFAELLSSFMGRLDSLADGSHQLKHLPLREAVSLRVLIQMNSIDELHCVVVRAAGLAAVVDARDVGVLQPGREFHLPPKADLRPLRSKPDG